MGKNDWRLRGASVELVSALCTSRVVLQEPFLSLIGPAIETSIQQVASPSPNQNPSFTFYRCVPQNSIPPTAHAQPTYSKSHRSTARPPHRCNDAPFVAGMEAAGSRPSARRSRRKKLQKAPGLLLTPSSQVSKPREKWLFSSTPSPQFCDLVSDEREP